QGSPTTPRASQSWRAGRFRESKASFEFLSREELYPVAPAALDPFGFQRRRVGCRHLARVHHHVLAERERLVDLGSVRRQIESALRGAVPGVESLHVPRLAISVEEIGAARWIASNRTLDLTGFFQRD